MPEPNASPNASPNANPSPDPGPESARHPASDTGSRGGSPPKPRGSHIFQAPTGTRDLYPEDVARRRYLTQAWRDVSVRHGFEEIEGPTFEHLDLYTVKSGEGIVSELFSFKRTGGDRDYALRPEFTPTLARMYAARAGSLQRPTKWFTAGPYFRAERPQRGRLREFLQWNVDIMGLPGDVAADSEEAAPLKAEMDADCIGCNVGLIQELGLSPSNCIVNVNDRSAVEHWLISHGCSADRIEHALALLDKKAKLPASKFVEELNQLGITPENLAVLFDSMGLLQDTTGEPVWSVQDELLDSNTPSELNDVFATLNSGTARGWTRYSTDVVRGLAYYTGTVFEVIADGERAVAGGGRYDKLIELFGGPPTPAVGFGMGDVVLSLLLQDHNLMPEGSELLDAISRPPASVRPEVFVINAGNRDDAHELEPLVTPLLADLRRGVESEAWRARDDRKPWNPDRYELSSGGVRPLHARKSYKSTKNLKKLLADASRQHARFAAIIHANDRVQLKDLDRRFHPEGDLTPHDIPGLPSDTPEFSVDPASPVFVGRAVAALLP